MEHPVLTTVTEGFDDLPALRDQWSELFCSRAHEPSTSFEWTIAMARNHVRPSDRCVLVQLRRDGRLHGLVPLVVRSVPFLGQPVTMLAPLSEEYNTHSDLLLRSTDADTMSAFLRALFELQTPWDYFRMARLVEEGETAVGLREALASRGPTHQAWDGIAAYVLAMPASYEQYLAARSAKFRNHLKRSERKLAEAGSVAVAEVGSDVEAGLNALMQVERASWKHTHGSAISALAHQTAFYRDFCLGAHAEGRLHLHWLTIDERPIAYNLGYLQGDRYHYLKTSYDEALRALSPSTVLRARLIEGLIRQNVKVFDFPGEPYEWETQWTDTARWRQVLTVYGGTFRGRLLHLAERVRHLSGAEKAIRHVDPRATRPPSSAPR